MLLSAQGDWGGGGHVLFPQLEVLIKVLYPRGYKKYNTQDIFKKAERKGPLFRYLEAELMPTILS